MTIRKVELTETGNHEEKFMKDYGKHDQKQDTSK